MFFFSISLTGDHKRIFESCVAIGHPISIIVTSPGFHHTVRINAAAENQSSL